MMIRIIPLVFLALLASCAGERAPLTTPSGAPGALAKVDWNTAKRIRVTLESFDFAPNTLRLDMNHAYVLLLDNVASSGHNFDAPEFFAKTALAEGVVERTLRTDGGVIEVGARQSVEIRLIPLQAGVYRLICSHPLHESFGMHGKIIVQ